MIKLYEVGIMEVHVNVVEVMAETPEEAKEKAKEMAKDGELNLEYSHTLDSGTWIVCDGKGPCGKFGKLEVFHDNE
jgi:hypothetical protein